MGTDADDREQSPVEERFTPGQGRSLSEAVLDTIGRYKGEDIPMTDFVLYDDIDPDALDNLFRSSSKPRTTVAFTTDDVRVELWGNGGVQIRVRSRTGEELGADNPPQEE